MPLSLILESVIDLFGGRGEAEKWARLNHLGNTVI